MDTDFAELIDAALRALWERDPVAATFAGQRGYDGRFPRADAAAEADERHVLDALAQRLATATNVPSTAAARIDARHLAAHTTLACSDFTRRARYRNPAWYTGEANFGIIALLLTGRSDEDTIESLRARLRALPDFLNDGAARLQDVAVPAGWVSRARTEIGALKKLLRDGLPLHPAASAVAVDNVAQIEAACERFTTALASTRDAQAACGEEHFALILAHVHGLADSPAALERRATAAFYEVLAALEAQAAQRDSGRDWRAQIAELSEIGPDGGDVTETYRYWHERALHDARSLLTPASEYGLAFSPLPPWAQAIAPELYFLFYRSPPAYAAGDGSTYWVNPAHGSAQELRRLHNTAAVKLIHAVHHGSIGHHTQNARARSAASRFAQIAGTDAASGITLLAAGTMVEGWACYAEDLLAEIPGFYTAAEQLQLTYFELRNIGSALADIRYHLGAYTLKEMEAFYRDDVAFAPARIGPETTRNSMFPGSRVMYWCGSQKIKALRSTSPLGARDFHDALLAYGAAPVAWIGEELAR